MWRVTVLLLFASFACASAKPWQSGTLVKIASSEGPSGTAVAPIGGMILGVPIRNVTVFFYIHSGDLVYVGARRGEQHPLNITLNGPIRFFVAGTKLHILDDADKEQKMKLIQKIAKKKDD